METRTPAYPRPQLERAHWMCLNGNWRFAFDGDRRYSDPSQIDEWPLTINVPFPPESEASGIGDTSLPHGCWYERDFDAAAGRRSRHPSFRRGRLLARVWVNGRYITSHEGGHTPFHADITARSTRRAAKG